MNDKAVECAVGVKRPTGTYRLQLNHEFTLADARSTLPYLRRLGVSHLYCSPILRARSGSTHGYDIVDPRSLNPELGTEDDLRSLASEAAKREMGIVLDIVPNHMATGEENPYWEDVLRHGPDSPYARWFDIDWDAAGRRVFLPVLGKRLGQAIQDGELSLALVSGRVRIRYFDQSFPVDPTTLPVLFDLIEKLVPQFATSTPAQAIRKTLGTHLGSSGTTRGTDPATRKRIANEAQRGLDDLFTRSPDACALTESALTAFTRAPDGHRALSRLLEAQPYRLAYWRRAAREINYRRFFTISHLVAVRQEDAEVFRATHELVLRWIHEGLVQGLRIDHVDGLLDPTQYLERLHQATTKAPPGDADQPAPLYVEKILAPGERLLSSWPVAGTTGYDFLNLVEDVFFDPHGLESVERRYRRLVGRRADFLSVARDAKRRILRGQLAADVSRIAQQLDRLYRGVGRAAALDRSALARAIIEVIAHLDAYRVYYDGSTGTLTDPERRYVQEALDAARESNRAPHDSLGFLWEILLPQVGSDLERSPERIAFVQRLQQVAVPAAAKGVEDTAFYAYVPLVSRAEVGGDPHRPTHDAVLRLHEENATRASEWPGALLCVSTHDTKRSADVRARLDVLSELGDSWIKSVRRWRRWNRRWKGRVRGRYLPDANTEYLLYQTLVGIWPLEANDHASMRSTLMTRLEEYMLKAAREAKVYTSWVEPDTEFEHALVEFVHALFGSEASRFLGDVARFATRIGKPGLWNSLARSVIHLTAPGVPDVYQGDELWNFSLVDPDNRRPVDFTARERLLDGLASGLAEPSNTWPGLLRDMVDHAEDGRLKLHVIRRLLALRRHEPLLFQSGSYHALPAAGPAADHLVAFARRWDSRVAVTLVPRLITSLQSDLDAPPLGDRAWGETTVVLPPDLKRREWQCVLTGRSITAPGALPLARVLTTLPVSVLLSTSAG